MDKRRIETLLAEIGALSAYHHTLPGTTVSLLMRCLVLPQLDWDPQFVEKSLQLTLPKDLQELWNETSGLVIFQDMTYAQWGLIIWSPDQAVARHRRYACERADTPGALRPGDFIVGEFLGDLDLPVLRCQPAEDDFGKVFVAQDLEPRDQWPIVAASIGEFIEKFFHTNLQRFGVKYWEQD